jgi:hypothetical protein
MSAKQAQMDYLKKTQILSNMEKEDKIVRLQANICMLCFFLSSNLSNHQII